MKKVTIILLFISTITLHSQIPVRQYNKLLFADRQPIWYEVAFEESLVNNECDGFNNLYDWTEVDPIVDGNFMYSVLEVRTNKSETEGAYIEKRNIKNGQLEWKIIYDLNVLDYQEIPFKMYLGNENDLIVHGFRIGKDDGSSWPFLTVPRAGCLLTYRRISIDSGEILEFYTPEDNDETAAKVSASVEKNNLYGNLFLTENEDEFLYWERRLPPTSNPKQIIHFSRVNKFGIQLTDTDSVILGPINVVINLIQLSRDTILYIEGNVETQQINLYYLNQEFVKIDSIVLEKFPSQIRNNKMFVSLFGKTLLIRSIVFNGENFSEHTGLYGLDGKLLDFIELKNTNRESYVAQVDQKHNRIVGMKAGFKFEPVEPVMELFKSLGNDSLEIARSLQVNDSLRIGYLQRLFYVNQDQILIQFYETSIYKESSFFKFDNYARAHSFLLFDADDIGLSTVSNISTNHKMIAELFPNPTFDLLTINYQDFMNGHVQIYNSFGGEVFKDKIQNLKSITIPVYHLPSGLYILRIQDDQKGVCKKKFVKM